ncbi:MAG: hypothetical protein QOE41_4812 [Mycobacterium sp.]|jgi:hypothetical protein|nr:hypothetical protein [Mycobacterium sp.]
MQWDSAMQWDDVVDVVCVGSGAGGLATAIVAVDAGQSVFVAQSPSLGQRPPDRFGVEVCDDETNEYLDALTVGIGSASSAVHNAEVPVRIIDGKAPAAVGCRDRRRVVEPFVGAQLRDWAACCATAAHGVLYSRVTDRNMTTMRPNAGETFEAAIVGSLPDDTDVTGPFFADRLADWLVAEARDRGIDVGAPSPLDRLVFEEGQIVGAVVTTPQGTCAVHARHGVVLTSARQPASDAVADDLPREASVEVCVVSKTASRFGRVELLGRPPVASRFAATSPPLARQLRSQRVGSAAWCRSVPTGWAGGF